MGGMIVFFLGLVESEDHIIGGVCIFNVVCSVSKPLSARASFERVPDVWLIKCSAFLIGSVG